MHESLLIPVWLDATQIIRLTRVHAQLGSQHLPCSFTLLRSIKVLQIVYDTDMVYEVSTSACDRVTLVFGVYSFIETWRINFRLCIVAGASSRLAEVFLIFGFNQALLAYDLRRPCPAHKRRFDIHVIDQFVDVLLRLSRLLRFSYGIFIH